jgi:PAS domain S-box-containing protein
MAEPEMCVPYMRWLAEQRSDRIIETSPNGIVILDEHLNIINMNPAFQRMFMCSSAVLGKRISYLMDPVPFEKLASGESERVELITRHDSYSLVCHELMYELKEEKQFVGIFVNVTKSHDDEDKLRRLRNDTVMQAQELLTHQLAMAQQMAKFLGESTAQGESLVRNLMHVAGAREE